MLRFNNKTYPLRTGCFDIFTAIDPAPVANVNSNYTTSTCMLICISVQQIIAVRNGSRIPFLWFEFCRYFSVSEPCFNKDNLRVFISVVVIRVNWTSLVSFEWLLSTIDILYNIFIFDLNVYGAGEQVHKLNSPVEFNNLWTLVYQWVFNIYASLCTIPVRTSFSILPFSKCGSTSRFCAMTKLLI